MSCSGTLLSTPRRRAPRLALTGATGRIAGLLRPHLPDALWLRRTDDWAHAAGHDALICLAGKTSGSKAVLAANTEVALRALRAARHAAVPRVFLMSSAAVYGLVTPPHRSDASPTPTSAYGAAKADMEEAVASWRQHMGNTAPHACCLRLGNVAGADALLGALKPGRQPDLHTWDDGISPRRSYIGPRSLAKVLQGLALAEDLPPVLNVATPGAVEMADLLRAAGHSWRPVPAPGDAIREVVLDTTPLRALVSLQPQAGTADAMVSEWREVSR